MINPRPSAQHSPRTAPSLGSCLPRRAHGLDSRRRSPAVARTLEIARHLSPGATNTLIRQQEVVAE
jgi:hypothetical protein